MNVIETKLVTKETEDLVRAVGQELKGEFGGEKGMGELLGETVVEKESVTSVGVEGED